MNAIMSQLDNNCVLYAFSIIRAALGYTDKLTFESGLKTTQWIIEHAGECFPLHEVLTFASMSLVHKDERLSKIDLPNYKGDTIPSDFPWDDYICAFEYHMEGKENENGHMAVGTPCLYPGMATSCIVCIKIDTVAV